MFNILHPSVFRVFLAPFDVHIRIRKGLLRRSAVAIASQFPDLPPDLVPQGEIVDGDSGSRSSSAWTSTRAAAVQAVSASISTPVRSMTPATATPPAVGTGRRRHHAVEPDGMTKGDERRRPLGGHDPGEPRRRQELGHPRPVGPEPGRVADAPHRAAGLGHPTGQRLAGDVDHAGLAVPSTCVSRRPTTPGGRPARHPPDTGGMTATSSFPPTAASRPPAPR